MYKRQHQVRKLEVRFVGFVVDAADMRGEVKEYRGERVQLTGYRVFV